MNTRINLLRQTIEPYREQIINHKVYGVIKNLDDLKIFMKFHVFAVWDFMSLLKSLQNKLTCTSVPWLPVGDAETRFLINEIVLGEESDIDADGKRKSHFEMYIDAMQQAGADIKPIFGFIEELKNYSDLNVTFEKAKIPEEAKHFMNFTFQVINSNKAHLQAAVFTFGREDLIPGMFISLIKDLNQQFPDSISGMKYYLDRHIEVDGGHHGELSLKMTNLLCGESEDKWKEATLHAVESLKHRILLWDGIYNEIISLNK
jgi:hypothetical protein